MADLTIKQDDTYPPLSAVLSDAEGPVDLSAAIDIKVFLQGPALPLISGTCIADADQVANKGKMTHTWLPAETATVGIYEGEIQVKWTASQIQTFPNDDTFEVEIVADLGD
jgi:hypothetical protein